MLVMCAICYFYSGMVKPQAYVHKLHNRPTKTRARRWRTLVTKSHDDSDTPITFLLRQSIIWLIEYGLFLKELPDEHKQKVEIKIKYS